MCNYYNEKHPQAPFVNFFVCSLLLPSGARKTLAYGSPPIDMVSEEGEPLKVEEKLQAVRLHSFSLPRCTDIGSRAETLHEARRETDVKFVDFQVGPIREVLEKEFGFKFD